jgi:hypothetical protein
MDAKDAKIPEDDAKVIQAIEDKIFTNFKLGFNMSELNILDDVNASKRKIQDLGVKIAVDNAELAATILKIAHSVYFDRSPHGEVPDFFDAVLRMGADRVKVLIFSISLFSLGKSPEAKLRAAKGASIGILGRIIAEQMNLNDECVRRVETGGLLSQLGKNIFMKAREIGADLSDDFIKKYEVTMATRLIERLQLDPFLKKAMDLSALEFDENSIALTGIIKLAATATQDSFDRYGKLVLKSPLPDKNNVLTRTTGDDVKKLFAALGVEEFVEIQEVPTEHQAAAAAKQGKVTAKKG